MNILYLSLAGGYLNPTKSLVPVCLHESTSKVRYYGPGLVANKYLNMTVPEYLVDIGFAADVIVIDESFLFAQSARQWLESSKRDLKRSFNVDYSLEALNKEMFYRVHDFLLESSLPKIAILLQSDFYNFKKSHINDICGMKLSAIVGFGCDFIDPVDDIVGRRKESFFSNLTDTWHDFLVGSSLPFLSLPHFVGDNEFHHGPASGRRYLVNVPGVRYSFRSNCVETFKANNIKLAPSNINHILKALDKFGFNVYGNYFLLNLMQEAFRKSINESSISVTCGSSLNWPLRKFFEIPARGSVLLAQPFNKMNEYGFVDRKNCWLVNSAEEAMSAVEFLSRNTAIMDTIAVNGRELVCNRHSVSARRLQLANFIKKVL